VPPSITGFRATITVASLVLGPLLMSIGDLFHPAESHDAAAQAAIILEDATPWYFAHLFLFVGMLVFVPGLLALPELVAKRNPTAGWICRILVIMGAAGFAGVFVGEMLLGRYVIDGADQAAETALISTVETTLLSGPAILAAVTFVGGVGLAAAILARAGGVQRWAGFALAFGLFLILVEIASADVMFSKIGNIMILAGCVALAWHIWRCNSNSGGRTGDASPSA